MNSMKPVEPGPAARNAAINQWTGKDVYARVTAFTEFGVLMKCPGLPLTPRAALYPDHAAVGFTGTEDLRKQFPWGNMIAVRIVGFEPRHNSWTVSRRALLVAQWTARYPQGTILDGCVKKLFHDNQALVELAPGFTGRLGARGCALLHAMGRWRVDEQFPFVIEQWLPPTGQVMLDLAPVSKDHLATREAEEFAQRCKPGAIVTGRLTKIIKTQAVVWLAPGVHGVLTDGASQALRRSSNWHAESKLAFTISKWSHPMGVAWLDLDAAQRLDVAVQRGPVVISLAAQRLKKYRPGVTVRGWLRPLTPQTAWIELEPDFAGTLSRESCTALQKAGRWRAGDEIWVKTRSWTTRSELLVDLAAAPAPASLPARAA